MIIELRQARAYLEAGWTRGAQARDVHGQPCTPDDFAAVRWSAVGALNAANPAWAKRGATWTYAAGGLVGGWPDLETFNDAPGRTRAEVLAVFDSVIAATVQAEATLADAAGPPPSPARVARYALASALLFAIETLQGAVAALVPGGGNEHA